MSRGYELNQARSQRREELTRRWEYEHPGQALTPTRLTHYAADHGGGNRSRLIQIALLVRQLTSMGVGGPELREAFQLDDDGLRDARTRPLVADASVAQTIEAQVLTELPETPEPDRHVPVTGPLYQADPLWQARAAAIDRELKTAR